MTDMLRHPTQPSRANGRSCGERASTAAAVGCGRGAPARSSAADGLEPRPTRLERLASGCRGALRRRPPRPRRARPRASSIASCSWPSMPSERAFFSGSSRCQCSSSSERTWVSTLRRRSSTDATWSRGTLPISSQLRWIRLSAGARLLGVGLGEQLLGLVEQRELLGRGCPEGLVLLRVDLGLGAEEHVAGGLELRPERRRRASCRRGRRASTRRAGAVVGDRVGAARRERLGPLDERLLAGAHVAVRGVELGEERLAVRLDRRARGAESLPELVGLVLGQARAVLLVALPAGEQRVELGGHLLPLRLRRVLRGERLGLARRCACARRGRRRARPSPRPAASR